MPSNHRILPTAASFGWIHVAAAADPQRYAATRETMRRIATAIVLALLSTSVNTVANAAETENWSAPVNGLQMRLTLKEEPKQGTTRTRWFVPYLELRNVRNLASPMEVSPDRDHLRIELIYADGKPVTQSVIVRSGPHAGLGTISLPMDSTISMGLKCTNWGISPTAVAAVPTDWNSGELTDEQNGKVFLRATLKATANKKQPAWKAWYGELQSPLLKVAWK